MNNKNSHVFISCYLNDNDFLLLNVNVLFFELKTKKAKKRCVVTKNRGFKTKQHTDRLCDPKQPCIC